MQQETEGGEGQFLQTRVQDLIRLVDSRGVRMDMIDQRISGIALRINDLEQQANTLAAAQLVRDETRQKDERFQQLLVTLATGAVGLAVTSIGLTVSVLVILLNHLAGK